MKYNIYDKVRINKEHCMWYFTDEAKMCYAHPRTGTVDTKYFMELEVLEKHIQDRDHFAIVTKLNHPDSECENYALMLGGMLFLIETKNISKYRYIANRPKEIL